MDEKWMKKINSKNMQKEQFYENFESNRAGRCRERRYADHIFIQIYSRMHHFVVELKNFFASGGNGALTPLTKILRTPLATHAIRFGGVA